jgi:hypothetical protein
MDVLGRVWHDPILPMDFDVRRFSAKIIFLNAHSGWDLKKSCFQHDFVVLYPAEFVSYGQ